MSQELQWKVVSKSRMKWERAMRYERSKNRREKRVFGIIHCWAAESQ